MYQFGENLDQTQRFNFPRAWIENKNWAVLPNASKAVLPVIAAHVNVEKNMEAFPSEQTIAILAGITDKVARDGIRDLAGFPGFSFDYYITRRGRRSKKFRLQLPKEHVKGRDFPFFRYVLEAGCWCQAKPASKCLYPVLRHFGYFSFDECVDDADPIEFEQEFKNREFDLCEAEIPILAEYAGITRQSVYSALRNLQACCLLEPFEQQWKIFLRSNGRYFKRDFLNDKVKKAYAHLL